MNKDEIEQILEAFKSQQIQIAVATQNTLANLDKLQEINKTLKIYVERFDELLKSNV